MSESIDPERLVAYIDGEVDTEESQRLEAAITAQPALVATVELLRADAATIRAAYQAPLREEPPQRLIAVFDGTTDGSSGGVPLAATLFRHPFASAIAASIVALVVGLSGAYYFAERGVDREIARLEAIRAADQEMLEAAVALALERHVSGTPVEWHNPDSGSRGAVEPVRTFKISTGQWCREYLHKVEFQGWQQRREMRRAIACRETDGRWRTRLRLDEES